MLLSRNKKNNVYPCKPQFYYINVGFKGVTIIYACFRDVYWITNFNIYIKMLNYETEFILSFSKQVF